MPIEVDNGYIYINDNKYAVAMLTSPYGGMESANNSLLVEYVDSVVDVAVSISVAPLDRERVARDLLCLFRNGDLVFSLGDVASALDGVGTEKVRVELCRAPSVDIHDDPS